MPSDTFEGIYDIFWTNIRIFFPELPLEFAQPKAETVVITDIRSSSATYLKLGSSGLFQEMGPAATALVAPV